MAKTIKAFILYYPVMMDVKQPHAVLLAVSYEKANQMAEELLKSKEFVLNGVPLFVE